MTGPLSVEDILAKQKAEKEAAAKPKFLSKAERAKLALEKRNAEVKNQQARDEEERASRIAFEQKLDEERRRSEDSRYNGGGGGRQGGYGNGNGNGRDGYRREDRYNQYNNNGGGPPQGQYQRNNGPQGQGKDHRQPPSGPRGAPSGPRGSYGNGNGSYGNQPSTSSPLARGRGDGPSSSSAAPASPIPNTPGDVSQPSDYEMAVIKSRYLGQKDPDKKQRIKKEPNAKNKMNFDWNASDDTTAHEQGSWRMDVRASAPGAVMLGGRLAGFDEGGQRRGQVAVDDQHADALERRRAGKGNNDDRHWSDKPLEEMKDRDWRIFREDYSISARGGSIPLPLRSWRESNIPESILGVIEDVGYTEPSPIQRQAIPIGMQNRDLIGIAKTGSGKTAAFVVPMLSYIGNLPPFDDDNRHLGPYALIMAPTRELAQQIESETQKFAARLGYTTVSIIGGRSVEEQRFALRNGAHVIVATPGRLKDMISNSMIVLSQCRYVVLDEADRMIDMGFEVDLNLILDSMPATFVKPDDNEALYGTDSFKGWRVTTLFSATMPPAVERLSRKYLRKPATVTIGDAGEAVDTVDQRVEFISSDEKKKTRLIEILRNGGYSAPIIVFVNQLRTADVVLRHVHAAGWSGVTLSSAKTQDAREAALKSVRDGEVQALVATDVAGRGIDIPDVSLVINWQMADNIERYTHRIGRTGRAGKTGVAITFLSNDDDETFFELKNLIEKSPISKMNPELARHEGSKQKITKEMKRKRDEQD